MIQPPVCVNSKLFPWSQHTADGVEKSGHIGDLAPRAILVTSLRVHCHSLFTLVLDDTSICSVVRLCP